ncbi:hypothetical protein [Streptomyces gobiensis]|uniref:hypothetical protein n=1 Tax=Streptomyces gobiensis TaxID=2875706 RepID=UPI001E58C6FE|nr:hypothetical protein [Streptomyces gobiensis]UGY92479.1 hypothetical protein test1122_12625 [Streptomyces gobiensis]
MNDRRQGHGPGPAARTSRATVTAWKTALEDLTDRMWEDCAAAVHPEEIAALLEADGLTDTQIQTRYGFPDSFALAEELFALVPRDHHRPPPPQQATPSPAELLRYGLRGLVFALPALGYVLGSPLLSGPADAPTPGSLPPGTLTLLAGALTGWAWSQALAHRAYFLLGLGDRAAAARALARGGALGALASAVVAAAAPGGGAGPWSFAAGQACYLASATVLLVSGQERALFAALLPVTAGGIAATAYDLPDALRAALLGCSLAAVVALAVMTVLEQLAADGDGTDRPAAPAPALWASVPYGLLGLGTGVLVMLAILADVLRHGAEGSIAAPTALALSLSMGPAEWLLARFRARTLAKLRDRTTFAAFRGTVAAELACGLLGYLAVLALLTWAGGVLWPYGPDPHGAAGLALPLLLGTVLWTALLLQSFGRIAAAVTACGAAAIADVSALLLHPASPVAIQLAVCAVAAAVLPVLAWALLARACSHR